MHFTIVFAPGERRYNNGNDRRNNKKNSIDKDQLDKYDAQPAVYIEIVDDEGKCKCNAHMWLRGILIPINSWSTIIIAYIIFIIKDEEINNANIN